MNKNTIHETTRKVREISFDFVDLFLSHEIVLDEDQAKDTKSRFQILGGE